ncbi:MAG: N-6 DNA methylase [Armatimonadota bacterium]|nr:N-6 DNA methylase [Armatimonadota bacterium]
MNEAFARDYLRLQGEGTRQRIIYRAINHSERFADPEEKVRAAFYAELIFKYGYAPERIGVEVTVPDRTPRDAADLVVFHDDAHTRPFAVIECKRDGVSDAEFSQAVEQVCGNGTYSKFRAAYVGVIAGATRRWLDFSDKYGVLEREANIIADLPRGYGKPQEWRFHYGVGDWEDIRPVSKGELIAAIRKCHQTLWGGGRLSPQAAFGEFCKIIFVKIQDEKAPRKIGKPYEFQIRTHESPQMLAERIRKLYREAQKKEPEVFTETLKVDDRTLRTVVSHLESINFSETDLDTKGVAFEQFLDGFFKGDFGQYFTPREIIQFCVEMLDPTANDVVLDPACGSGGFLLYTLDHVRHRAEDDYESRPHLAYRVWHDFARDNLHGIEINEEIARVAKMNMILHDDGHTNVVGFDALEHFEVLSDKSARLKPEAFDLVLTNPPFGAVVKASEKGDGYLRGWELLRYIGKNLQPEDEDSDTNFKSGRKAIKARKSVKTEILFCERVWNFLRPGGRAAIVLPDGILTNASLQGVRDWLMERFEILAVVSLPQYAFQHSGAGVKASIVFLCKREPSEEPDDEREVIFMAAPENIGYDATGRKTYKVIASREEGDIKVEIRRTDLFDVEVTFERVSLTTAVVTAGTPEIGAGLAANGALFDADSANNGQGNSSKNGSRRKIEKEIEKEFDKEKPRDEWSERRSRVIPNTGLLSQYRDFLRDPKPFFV